jgi:dTDP-4-amino-4,6-dideoxygalactose transaminase
LPFRILLGRVKGEATEPVHANAALSNLDGAIALAQFEALARHAAERRRHARTLRDNFSLLSGKVVTDISPAGMVVKLVYLVPETGPTVEEAIEVLARNGIEAQGGYAPLHTLHGSAARLPSTDALWQRVLCLPVETRPNPRQRIALVQRAIATLATPSTAHPVRG